MQSNNRRSVVGIFRDVAAFERMLGDLLKAGFDPSSISVLGNHQAIVDHFGQFPRLEEITDAVDTPREALDTEVSLHKAIEFIASTFAVISEVSVATAAYAVGGPVGVAAASANLTDATVDSVLSGYVDDTYHRLFQENVRDGGMICWVQTPDDDAAALATQMLTASGGQHIHKTEF